MTLTLLSSCFLRFTSAQSAPVKPPDTPAGRTLAAWLDAFNSANPAKIDRYIVGETTGGGAHPMRGFSIDAHFFIDVPVARPINPITKTDWEGTGVTPDYKTSRDEALPTAINLAEAKLESEDNSTAAVPGR